MFWSKRWSFAMSCLPRALPMLRALANIDKTARIAYVSVMKKLITPETVGI